MSATDTLPPPDMAAIHAAFDALEAATHGAVTVTPGKPGVRIIRPVTGRQLATPSTDAARWFLWVTDAMAKPEHARTPDEQAHVVFIERVRQRRMVG